MLHLLNSFITHFLIVLTKFIYQKKTLEVLKSYSKGTQKVLNVFKRYSKGTQKVLKSLKSLKGYSKGTVVRGDFVSRGDFVYFWKLNCMYPHVIPD